jgi:hypothetical protein
MRKRLGHGRLSVSYSALAFRHFTTAPYDLEPGPEAWSLRPGATPETSLWFVILSKAKDLLLFAPVGIP